MIGVSWVTAIMVYLCLTLFTLLLIWGATYRKERRKRLEMITKDLYRCEYCGSVYLDEAVKTVTACPKCGSLNKDNSYR